MMLMTPANAAQVVARRRAMAPTLGLAPGSVGRQVAWNSPVSSRGEAAVSEVVGFILMFALSVIILVVSMQAFNVIRDSSKDLSDANELRLFAAQVASEAALFGKISNDFPNASFESTIRAPDLVGRSYYVEATNKSIFANTTDGRIQVNSTTFRLEAIPNLVVTGEATPTGGLLKVTYSYDSGANRKTITIKSG